MRDAERQLSLRVGERLCHDAVALTCNVLTYNASRGFRASEEPARPLVARPDRAP
jgi:hypothetical protein